MYEMFDTCRSQSRAAQRASLFALVAAGLLAAQGCGSSPAEPLGGGGGGSGGGGGGGTAGTGGTGGGGGAPQPIVADEDTWTWVPIDGAICGTGSGTGLGINPTSKSGKLLVYLQGGGVCYNADNCLGPDPGAANFDGFGPTEFAEFTADDGKHGLFDRADGDNPLRDFSFVFVPYCTGDIHAGNKVTGGLSFVGQANLIADLARLVPTFPSPEQVVLAGSSAGGFGAMYNFFLVEAAFAPAPAVLIDDSAPFFPIAVTPGLSVLVNIYGLKDTVAPGCDKCVDLAAPDGGLHQLIPHYAKTLPGRRGSLLSSLQDETIAGNFSLTAEEFETELTKLADEVVPTNPDFHVYLLSGSHHVWLFGGDAGDKLGDVTSNGVALGDFLRQQLEDDAGWDDVRP